MRSLTRRLAANLRKRQAGFTLVELLVVVGIIVALGAVIVPNVIQFASSGEKGARTAEAASVQSAIDTMMTDTGTAAVLFPPIGTGSPENDFSFGVGTIDLTTYLRNPDTKYDYCWDASGLLTFPTEVDIENGDLLPLSGFC